MVFAEDGTRIANIHDNTGGDRYDSRLNSISVAVSGDGSHIFANAKPENSPHILNRSTDGGNTFDQTNNLPNQLSNLDVSDDGQELIAVTSNGEIHTSNDVGDSWMEQAEIGQDWASVAISGDGSSLVAVEQSGNIFTTVPDETAPTLASSTPFSPADDTTEAGDSDPTVTFSESVIAGSGDITLYDATDNTVIEVIDVTSGQITGTGSDTLTISPSAGLQDGVSYYIQIDPGALTDYAGNTFAGITDSTTWNFTTGDNTVPDNSSITFQPFDDSTSVALDTNLEIYFPEKMEAGSGNITINQGGSTVETISATSSQVSGLGTETITITPSADFAEETSYNIQIESGSFVDVAGNEYAGITDATTWNFTIQDATPPTVGDVSFSPADNATDVTATELFPEITFPESMLKGDGTFTIYESATDSIFNQLNTDSDRLTGNGSTTITAYPTEDFAYDTEYYIQLSPGGLTDEAENEFAGITDKTTWNFTTDTPSPAEAAANGDILIDFQEAVEKGSGNVTIYAFDGSQHEQIDVTTNQVTMSDNNLTAVISPSTPLDDDRNYYILSDAGAFVYADDGTDVPATTDSTEWDFKTDDETAPEDPTPPQDMEKNDDISLTFNEPVNTGSGDFELRRSDDDSVVESVSADSGRIAGDGTDTLSFTPSDPLEDNTSYYTSIDGGAVTDTSGNSYPGTSDSSTFSFTTGDTAPSATETEAGDGSSDDGSNNESDDTIDSLTLVFDEPVEMGSGYITIYRSKDNSQVEKIDIESGQVTGFGTHEVTVTPSQPLDAGTNYYLNITPGAFIDSNGNKFPGVQDDSLGVTIPEINIPFGGSGSSLSPGSRSRASSAADDAESSDSSDKPSEDTQEVREGNGKQSCDRLLTEYLSFDQENDRLQVLKLQNFLNSFGNISISLSGVYDDSTKEAVSVFQEEYQKDTLSPWGYESGESTGRVYYTTRKAINERHCERLGYPETTFPLTSLQKLEIGLFGLLR